MQEVPESRLWYQGFGFEGKRIPRVGTGCSWQDSPSEFVLSLMFKSMLCTCRRRSMCIFACMYTHTRISTRACISLKYTYMYVHIYLYPYAYLGCVCTARLWASKPTVLHVGLA